MGLFFDFSSALDFHDKSGRLQATLHLSPVVDADPFSALDLFPSVSHVNSTAATMRR
jgi:hypothetical protein